MSVADFDFTGNDSVIGAGSIERVVRLTVFEAIPPFFPTKYVITLSFSQFGYINFHNFYFDFLSLAL